MKTERIFTGEYVNFKDDKVLLRHLFENKKGNYSFGSIPPQKHRVHDTIYNLFSGFNIDTVYGLEDKDGKVFIFENPQLTILLDFIAGKITWNNTKFEDLCGLEQSFIEDYPVHIRIVPPSKHDIFYDRLMTL